MTEGSCFLMRFAPCGRHNRHLHHAEGRGKGRVRQEGGESPDRQAGEDGWAASVGAVARRGCVRLAGEVRGEGAAVLPHKRSARPRSGRFGDRGKRSRGQGAGEPGRAAASESGERERGGQAAGHNRAGDSVGRKRSGGLRSWNRAGRQRHEREDAGEALSGMEKEAGQALQKSARRKNFFRPRWKCRGISVDNIL